MLKYKRRLITYSINKTCFFFPVFVSMWFISYSVLVFGEGMFKMLEKPDF